MAVPILTGPPASGKNTVAPLVAHRRDRCAVTDVDQVRWILLPDYLWDYTVPMYRTLLAAHEPLIVQLMPSRTETLRRNVERGWLPAHEVETLYTQMETLRDFDIRIDNTALSAASLADRLLTVLERH